MSKIMNYFLCPYLLVHFLLDTPIKIITIDIVSLPFNPY